MNKQVKDKLVKALRSGEYKQCQNQLKWRGGFCCLGVLCDIHSKETGTPWEGESYLGDNVELPGKVTDWSGLDATGELKENVTTENGTDCDSLVDLNDFGKCTFNQIADVIEDQF